MNNILENLNSFLNEQTDPDLIIAQITKWNRPTTINITVILKIKNGFASIEDCRKIHKLILIWSKKENIEKNLNISVQSESINKILLTKEDFEENLEKKIKIETKEKINDRRNFTGFLKKIKNDIIYLKSEKEEVELELRKIKKAQLLLI